MENDKKSRQSQITEAEITTDSFQINLDLPKQLHEYSQLQERLKQLAREAKISKQEVKEFKQKMTFMHTKILAEQPINDSANHIEVKKHIFTGNCIF
ncbi:putative cTAGE family member 3 [Ochotona curzoniae]|uniref:putative cTAGE family member 3 n=1 Tax=Ochotona curzoniae TaxID=130825 RepID=UPI001B34AE93|nr:putative cTAGE family member 3 [Ochotona curzoniae]